MRAADEIARQLRLRDMGGIIVVDFIDMAKAEHRQQLYEHMREIMANDRARHNILPLSKFGLMQITRQRVRPALDIHTAEKCPSCMGKGEVQPSILFTDTLFEKLEYIVNDLGLRDFIMYVHPYVEAYIKKGLFTSLYGKWRRSLGRLFKIMPDESLAYLQYRVVDKDRNELQLRDEKDAGQSSAAKNAGKRQRGTEDTTTQEAKPQPKAKAEPKPKTENKQKEEPKEQPKTKKAATNKAPKQKAEQKADRQTADAKPMQTEEKAAVKKEEPVETIDDTQAAPIALLPPPQSTEEVIDDGTTDAESNSEAPNEDEASQTAKKRRRRRRRKPKAVGSAEAETENGSDEDVDETSPSDNEDINQE